MAFTDVWTIGPWAALLALCGFLLLLRGTGAPCGPSPAIAVLMSLPCVMTLLFLRLMHPMTARYADDQSGLLDGRPWWHDAALWALWIVATAIHVFAVLRLSRRATPSAQDREHAPEL